MSPDPRIYKLVESAAFTTVETKTHDTHEMFKDHKRMIAVLYATAVAADVDDTLDVYVDFRMPGTDIWVNGVHFTQILGNGTAKRFYAVWDQTTPGTSVVDATSDASASAVRPTVTGDAARARHILAKGSDADQSFTYSLTLYGLD
jgi:hypothetical protein